MANKKITREDWLHRAARHLKPIFTAAGLEMAEDVALSVGFSKGSSKAIGQCWQEGANKKAKMENSQIFICPTLGKDVPELVAVLLHELVHATVGNDHGHTGAFSVAMRTMGFQGKLMATTLKRADQDLVDAVNAVVEKLPEYPHTPLKRKKPKKPAVSEHLRLYSTTLEGYKVNINRSCLEEYGRPVDPEGAEMVTGPELAELLGEG